MEGKIPLCLIEWFLALLPELVRVYYKMTPRPEQLDVRNGYLYLSAKWLKRNPQFRLSCHMQPRVARPHPMTLQPVAYVKRGPIVYFFENVDHQ